MNDPHVEKAVRDIMGDRAKLVFDHILDVSAQRNERWSKDQYTIMEKGSELGGEGGEVAEAALDLCRAIGLSQNVTKKLRRAELGMVGNYKPGETTREELLKKLEYEIGDVLVCVFNLCEKAGVDPWRALQTAFNAKSEQLGFPERL